jgi:hypothetical protein
MDETPGQLLERTLKRLGIKKVELARRIAGPKADYLLVHRWTKDRGFNEKNQRLVAEALELPIDYFARPDEAAVKELHARRTLERFLGTELGSKATPSEIRVLRSVKFVDDILPTETLYTLFLLALHHRLTDEQVAEALENNRKLLESARSKRAKGRGNEADKS